MKLPRRLRITREGKYFLGITFGTGLVAINTGNNLLYLLLGFFLSLIVISGVLSEMSLRHLHVTRRLPRRAQVGRAHLVEIEVCNKKSRLPSYAIEVEDLRESQAADKRCFFLKVSPGASQVAAYRRIPARRGIDRHRGFRIATRFPFGLFEKSRDIAVEDELIIYPAVDPVRLETSLRSIRTGGRQGLLPGRGDEILGLRPMREGDDPRDIYWRRSNLRTGFILRERVRESCNLVSLSLDNIAPPVMTDAWRQGYELRIRQVASLGVAHLRRGDDITLITSDLRRVRVMAAVGPDPLLTFLALLEPSTSVLQPNQEGRERS